MTSARFVLLLALCLCGLTTAVALAGPYDGTWEASRTSTTCPEKYKMFTFRVVDGRIGGPRTGKIDAAGNLTMTFRNSAKRYAYRAKLGASSGSGTWQREMFNGRANCGGGLNLRRID